MSTGHARARKDRALEKTARISSNELGLSVRELRPGRIWLAAGRNSHRHLLHRNYTLQNPADTSSLVHSMPQTVNNIRRVHCDRQNMWRLQGPGSSVHVAEFEVVPEPEFAVQNPNRAQSMVREELPQGRLLQSCSSRCSLLNWFHQSSHGFAIIVVVEPNDSRKIRYPELRPLSDSRKIADSVSGSRLADERSEVTRD